ncbi:MAG TPA: hypothetical protein VJV03_17605 [Pyrinomonadaceae bacterium]|nr:hypothetical protein [Pyrinomonadaceae bacterium]
MLAIFACVVVFGATASAQQTTTPRPAAPKVELQLNPSESKRDSLKSDPDVQAADIAIIADIKAESLLFEAVPNPKVEFPGNQTLKTTWEAFRDNLPNPVQPGVTYRNIGIRLKITSAFADIDRIVSEALGEVPVSDNTKPTDPKSSSTPNQESPATQSSSPPPPRER